MVPLEIALAHLVLCLYILLRRWLDDTTGRLFVAYLFLTALWNVNLAAIANGAAPLVPGLASTQLAYYGLVVLGIVYWTFSRAFLQRSWISPEGWAIGIAGLVVAVCFDMGWLLFSPAMSAGGTGRISA
jgi:hypothetical protein